MKNRVDNRIKLAGALSCALVITACGGGGGGGTATPGSDFFFDDDDCVPQNAGCFYELNGAGASIVQFDGNWLTDCIFIDTNDGKYSDDATYRIESMTVDGNAGTRTNNYYTASDCATPATVSEVGSTLELFYASVFTENTVGVDNIVLVNIEASDLTFDGAAPDADQIAEMDRARATRTFYTSMQRLGTDLHIGKPGTFNDGRNSGDRILRPYDEFDIYNETGIKYTQQ